MRVSNLSELAEFGYLADVPGQTVPNMDYQTCLSSGGTPTNRTSTHQAYGPDIITVDCFYPPKISAPPSQNIVTNVSPTVTTATNVSPVIATQVSPNISPTFQQQFQPQASPMVGPGGTGATSAPNATFASSGASGQTQNQSNQQNPTITTTSAAASAASAGGAYGGQQQPAVGSTGAVGTMVNTAANDALVAQNAQTKFSADNAAILQLNADLAASVARNSGIPYLEDCSPRQFIGGQGLPQSNDILRVKDSVYACISRNDATAAQYRAKQALNTPVSVAVPSIPVSAPADMSQVAPQTYPAIIQAPQSPYVAPLQYASYPAATVANTPASGGGMTYVDTSSMAPTPAPVAAVAAPTSNYLPWLIGGAILLLAATGKGAKNEN
jgi:hypothetical protein